MNRPAAAAETENPAPETLEGWYVLHDCYDIKWAEWRALPAMERAGLVMELLERLHDQTETGGGTRCYKIVSQKADLMFVHYRQTVAGLNQAENQFRQLRIYDYLTPRYGYLSVIEASLYEATARAHGMLARKGLTPGKDGFKEAFDAEIEVQKQHLNERVNKPIPDSSHICFYPMSKRRGEHVNWYDTSLDERRKIMRGHGKIGAKYHDSITQVISGSIGLDDWEWGVDLHGDNPLQFKKLIYEMRFDPASSRYAEFGPFYIGLNCSDADLNAFLKMDPA